MAVYLPEWQVQRLVKLVTLLCARLCRPCKVQTSSRKLIKFSLPPAVCMGQCEKFSGRSCFATQPTRPMQCCGVAVQGVGKWFEGAQGQSVYWAVSNDTGLTWGRTEAVIPSPDTLPLWGPVMYSTVRPVTLFRYLPLPHSHASCNGIAEELWMVASCRCNLLCWLDSVQHVYEGAPKLRGNGPSETSSGDSM